MDYKNADKKVLKENLKNKIHSLLTESMEVPTDVNGVSGDTYTNPDQGNGVAIAPQDQQTVQQIDQIDQTEYQNAIAILKKAVETSNGNNNQAFRTALLKEFEQLGGSNITVNMSASVSVANLKPTQNIIAADGSLGWILYKHPEQIKTNVDNAFAGDVVINNTPIITCGNYVVDGHHRWSQVYLLNPNATMKAIDLGLQTDDKTQILKLVQIAIANSQLGNGGQLPLSNAEGGINLLGDPGSAKMEMQNYIAKSPNAGLFYEALYPKINPNDGSNDLNYSTVPNKVFKQYQFLMNKQNSGQQLTPQEVNWINYNKKTYGENAFSGISSIDGNGDYQNRFGMNESIQSNFDVKKQQTVLMYCGNNAAKLSSLGSRKDPDRSLMPQTDKAAGGLKGTTSSLSSLANDAKADANNADGQQLQENKNKKNNNMKLTESQLIGLIGRAVRSVLSEGYQDKQPRTQSKEEHDEWVSRKSASKKAYYDSKRKESGEEGDSKDGTIDYYDYKHGKGNFPVMTKESKVRLSASEFQKFITESVKRTVNEMSGLPKNYDSRRTAVPNSWNEPDRIDKDDFFDMINSSDEREQKNFVDFVKEYLSDEYENGVSSTVEFLKQVSAGENPFMAAINLGVKWEDIALEFFDIKPVRSYLGDNDQDPRDTIRLSESHLRGIIGESVKRTINRMLTEHETWEPYGSPENEPLEDFLDETDEGLFGFGKKKTNPGNQELYNKYQAKFKNYFRGLDQMDKKTYEMWMNKLLHSQPYSQSERQCKETLDRWLMRLQAKENYRINQEWDSRKKAEADAENEKYAEYRKNKTPKLGYYDNIGYVDSSGEYRGF